MNHFRLINSVFSSVETVLKQCSEKILLFKKHHKTVSLMFSDLVVLIICSYFRCQLL